MFLEYTVKKCVEVLSLMFVDRYNLKALRPGYVQFT